MNTEIEERILEINKEEVEKKLVELGAKKVGDWHQKRYVYDFNPVRENEWIRLRDTGKSVTLTYSNINSASINIKVPNDYIEVGEPPFQRLMIHSMELFF